MRYSAVKANIRHWRKMYEQAGDPERTMVRAVTRAYGYADDWKQRAEAAEARVKEMDGMLDMLPEYLEYWDTCDGPALSLSEWWACRKNGYQ